MPIFGTHLDDDIVGTAGRLAAAALEPGGAPSAPADRLRDRPAADRAADGAARASGWRPRTPRSSGRRLVAEEYDTVDVQETVVQGPERGGGHRPGGAGDGRGDDRDGGRAADEDQGRGDPGGIGGHRPAEIGPVTEYVPDEAPCRVLVTAPVGKAEAPDDAEVELEALGGPVPEWAQVFSTAEPGGHRIESGTDVHRHRRMRPGRLFACANDAPGGARGFVPRRGPGGARAPGDRHGQGVGGHGRPVHGGRCARGRGAYCRRGSSARTCSSPRPTATTRTS